MCGRYTLRASPEAIARGLRVALESLPPLSQRYNIAPTQRILVLRAAADGQREAVLMRWGLPSAAGRLLVNARAETVARLPAFRDGFAHRRCLIPADGFYEWQKTGARKQPFFIHRPGDQLFAFAGIWQPGPDGPTAECVLITQAAGERVRPIHDRQPVRLPPEAWDTWLAADSDARSPDALAGPQALLVPPAVDDWKPVPVSNFVNRVDNDSPRCIDPVEPERQSELF
ncbi:MAG TPA: SOS response-associated peptidase [Pirellulales bacterium]|jgi:putative SOS response-associated peptidase YedK